MLIVGPGDTTLDLRFDLGQFDPRITLTRASVATHFDSRGNLVVVQANEPRIDYDLKSGFCRGLLVESARTNLLLQSAVLSTQAVNVTAVPHTLTFYGTGTVTLSGASTDGPLVGAGEQDRASLTFTPSAAALTLTVTGDVRLAQLEVGSFSSSYIPTTTVAVARAVDQAALITTDLFNDAEGTLYCEADLLAGGYTAFLAELDDGGTSNRHFLARQSAGEAQGSTRVGGGVEASILTGAGAWVSEPGRVAYAYKTNDFALVFDGTLAGVDAVGAVPTGLTRLTIGSLSGASPLNGHLQRLTYLPFRLPDGRLAEMTGPIGRVI